jgi:hypothetical protein
MTAEEIMTDLMFVELGAVVTEVLGPTRCTIEPFCDLQPPSYVAERRVEIDFARSLEHVLAEGLPVQAHAHYDPFVGPTDAEGQPCGSPPIGPSWPGAAYEGVVRIREDLVAATPALAEAAAALPGRPWEYQVVASIDEQTRTVRRYHGFHAEILRDEGSTLVLRVAHAGGSEEPSWVPCEVAYDAANAQKFYSGPLVADRVVGGGEDRRSSGAVFIELEAAVSVLGIKTAKLPRGAGL